ncbi:MULTISPECIES: flagellar hook assembly protein FlgD [Bacillus]|uniref:flagellar hook assembly protein FlgD n=1 Tax=Bacillus TaxID=1386 RepID=UPI000BB6C3AD|nr:MULTISPECIES: flagellar hook assembly protein FlgD [Bacillus]
MTKITSDLYIENRPAPEKNNNILGKDDFLRLLIAQLQNQDPLNPMEDKEFISQMANFSTLEQMTNLNKTMEKFLDNQTRQSALSMQQYLGAQIEWQELVETENGSTVNYHKDFVIAVTMIDGNSKLSLASGNEITTDQIRSVELPSDPTYTSYSLMNASGLIGKKVSIVWEDIEYNDMTVSSVGSKNGITYITFSEGPLANEKVPLDYITKISN